MIDFHAMILADDVAAQLADITRQMHAAATDPNAPAVRVLLCGPPGVGKTMAMMALAKDARFKPIPVGATEIRGRYIGQTSHLFAQLFERARASAPALLMFDAFEHIFTRRDDHRSNNISEESIIELLMALDGADRGKSRPAVCIVGEVIDLDLVDPAVLARIPLRIQLPLPDDECRREILRRAVLQNSVPLGADAEQTLDEWTTQLRGSSGRHIVNFAARARQHSAATPEAAMPVLRGPSPARPRDSASPGDVVATDFETIDVEGESLDTLGVAEPLLTQLRSYARLLRERDTFTRLNVPLPVAYLIKGDASAALRCVRALAAEGKMALRHITGQAAVMLERTRPESLQARLGAIVDEGPCLVVITDAEHVVPARGSPYFADAAVDGDLMVRTWTTIRQHIDAQRDASTYVPLVFTTANADVMDKPVQMRATVTFELPPTAIA